MHTFYKRPATYVGVKDIVQDPLITLHLLVVQGFLQCDPLQPFLIISQVLEHFTSPS